MVKIKFVMAVVVAAAGFSIFGMPLLAQRATQGAVQAPPQQQEPERKLMQFYADEQFNLRGTDTIIMLGNVVLHHNGAVVTCDSAVRYSENRFDCFGRVLINQDSTFIYCRQAAYDRDVNTARVFDRLIKVVSGTSVLYTYNFSFNTLDNVGRYWGGGTMLQDSNRMESERGWYYTDTKEIIAAGGVQMTDPEYKMISDSVRYNMDVQVAEFYTLTYIWNTNDEMLSATKGKYYNRTREYDFTADAYVLTAEQELWADSMRYNSETRDAVARRNIQMRDEEQQIMAFGDYGEWYGERQDGMLTLNPSLVGFDREAPDDSVYMCADSMFLYTIKAEPRAVVSDSMPGGLFEPPMLPVVSDSLTELPETFMPPQNEDGGVRLDSLPVVSDSLVLPVMYHLPALSFGQRVDSLADGLSAALHEDVIVVDTLQHGRSLVDTMRQDVDSLVLPSDSVSVAAVSDTIPRSEADSVQRVVRAYRNVKIWRRDLQAVCDSMVGFTQDSTAHMYIDPVLWNEQNQITASVIDIYTKNKELHHADFTGTPLMVAEIDTARYNQVKGLKMTSWFRDNEIFKHHVDGNAQSIYYIVEEGESEPHTIMISNSAAATFLIDSQTITQITHIGNPDHTGYPTDQIPDDLERRLDGFTWEIERRPTRADVFTREVRPSQRDRYRSIPQPQFPLTQKIEDHKRQLIGQRAWEERYELLSQAAIEWVRKIQLE